MKEMIMEIMQPVAVTVITAVIAAIGIYIRSKIKNATALRIYDEVIESLKAGMAVAQDEVIRPVKASKPKLNSSEIKKAESMAFDVAKSVAKGKALDYLEGMAEAEVKSMIKGIKSSLK